jgi:hypothetical protein
MSSSRLSYDECEHANRNHERVNPLTYALYSGKYLRCDWCGKKNPDSISELPFINQVTIETDLKNIDRKTTRCSNLKYSPACNGKLESCNIATPVKFTPARVCERDVVWTNLVKPVSTGIPYINTDKC